MDILVSIPRNQEEYVMATKLNPNNRQGLTHGYWTLSGHPRSARRGDRIWFAFQGEVIASARIYQPNDSFPAGCRREEDLPKNNDYVPAVCFEISARSLVRHEFSVPGDIPFGGFRGFRYVRRKQKFISPARTVELELVSAETTRKLYPKKW